MCGLVGVAGNINRKWAEVFRNLLLLDTLRGFDSTGVGLVKLVDNKMVVDKKVGTPTEKLWFEANWCDTKGVPAINHRVLMGHNRAATLGRVTEDNAHPFVFGHITGAHNGTLRSYDDLHLSHKHEVDSMSLIHNIAEHGIAHTWANFHGAAALTWWDEKDATLNFIRNKERPLWFALGDKGTVLVWASEKWMLQAAAIKAGATYDKKNGADDMWEMAEHRHHKYLPKSTTCELLEVNELSPKKEPEVKKHSYSGFTGRHGTTIIGGMTNTYRGDKYSINNHGKGFNWGWGRKLDKADKGALDGRLFKLSNVFDYHSTVLDTTVHIVQGAFLDGGKEMIQIYPETYSEWKDFRKAISEGRLVNTVYQTKMRARARMSAMGAKKPYCYCVTSKGLEVVEGVGVEKDSWYINRRNELIKDEAEAQRDLDLADCSCAYCGNVLTIEDNYTFLIGGQSVLCSECETSSPILTEWFGQSKGMIQ